MAHLKVEANLAATGFDRASTEVVRVDALRWAERSTPLDLAIIDPPYAFEGWPELLSALDAQVIVCESGSDLDPGPAWEVLKRKRYGSTVVTVAQPASGATE